ncbi:MAG: hypothetical protein WC365_07670 [Candidatus Babeliales bacterium]|jgi:hypothetical protein
MTSNENKNNEQLKDGVILHYPIKLDTKTMTNRPMAAWKSGKAQSCLNKETKAKNR